MCDALLCDVVDGDRSFTRSIETSRELIFHPLQLRVFKSWFLSNGFNGFLGRPLDLCWDLEWGGLIDAVTGRGLSLEIGQDIFTIRTGYYWDILRL
jgi:hypothetical protein